MMFFRKTNTKQETQNPDPIVNPTPINEAIVPEKLTAQEAADLWFEQKFGTPMPEVLHTLLKNLAKAEVKKQQAGSNLISKAETNKLQESLRLYETKLQNTEISLDRIRHQQEWYRKFITLTHNLDKEKKRLYELNKQYASIQKLIQELDRFESFESIQGKFQKIMLLEQHKQETKALLTEILQKKDLQESEMKSIQGEAEQNNLKRKNAEEILNKVKSMFGEAYHIKGKLQILDLCEGQELEICNKLEQHIAAQKKELKELLEEIESKQKEIEARSQEKQNLEAHAKMVQKGEGLLIKLDQLNHLKIRKENTQQELDNSLRKQSEQNLQLNKLFISIKDLESQISSLQDELSIHLKSNYGLESEKLQARTMELKRRKQLLQSAQSLWTHISSSYNMIERKSQEIYRLQASAENAKANIDRLSTETSLLKKQKDEKQYSFTVSKSQNVIQLRADLKEGSSCSVCGATHHPYHSDTMLEQSKLISEMKTDFELLEAEYNKKSQSLRELELQYAQTVGQLEVEQENLNIFKDILRQNVLEWKQFETLDRSFLECSPSTNQEARRSMLQQLIERTAQDAEIAAKELEVFNFHQANINSINSKIAKKENEKNDVMMRFNELNTGCQVWAYRISNLQETFSALNDAYSELFDELDHTITIPGWYKLWQQNHEGLKIQIQKILKKDSELRKGIEELHKDFSLMQQKLSLLDSFLKNNINNLEEYATRLERTQNLKSECINSQQKLVGDRDIKELYDEAYQSIRSCQKEEADIQQRITVKAKEIHLITGECQLLQEQVAGIENNLIQEKSDLDLWMRKYNATHSPVKFSELLDVFSNERDWQECREQIRTLKFELSMTQKNVDLLQAELAAHQVDGFKPATNSSKDTNDLLIERKESLEQERKQIIGQIAHCQAQIINQNEKTARMQMCDEEIRTSILK